MSTRILVGDARERLRELPDESVCCVITSPHYWGLRKYEEDPRMIGFEETFEEHIENLLAVFREVWRVLRADGTLWLNYGDAQMSGGWATFRSGASENKGHRVQDDMPRPDTSAGLKPKDLMMMPADVARALRADGWWLRQRIIWKKPNPMPESVTDRPTSSFEEVFLMSKNGDPLFWTHPEKDGVRCHRPEPDYEYVNRETGHRTRIVPAGWQDDDNWTRRNLWRGHDYFYDADAVRTPIKVEAMTRLVRNRNTGAEARFPPALHSKRASAGRLNSASTRNAISASTVRISWRPVSRMRAP